MLRNADRAIIEPAKLRDYLLNPANENNGGKWVIFAVLGYTRANWQDLETDLREQHLTQAAVDAGRSGYGVKHEIVASLRGARRSGTIRSFWQYDYGSEVPRFLTAY